MSPRFGPEQGRSEHRRLGSVPAVGLEPSVTYPPLHAVRIRPPARDLLSVEDQAKFSEWARRADASDDVATVADLAVTAAAREALDDAAFPPSPVLRVKWRRVAAWSPVLLLAGVGAVVVGRYICHHPPLFWACAVVGAYFLSLIEPAGRR